MDELNEISKAIKDSVDASLRASGVKTSEVNGDKLLVLGRPLDESVAELRSRVTLLEGALVQLRAQVLQLIAQSESRS